MSVVVLKATDNSPNFVQKKRENISRDRAETYPEKEGKYFPR